METANIFPVFGQLHAGDALPIERRALPNDAGLFVVGRDTGAEDDDAKDGTPPPLKVTGQLPVDLASALYCLSFLAEFFNALESSDLRRIAEEIEARP